MVLTLSLLPQASHKGLEFTTFTKEREEGARLKNEFIGLFLMLVFFFLPLGSDKPKLLDVVTHC